MPSIGFRGCRRSGLMPRNDSETGKSSAGLMPTSMASTVPKLRDGSGRTNQHELAGGGRGLRHGAATPSSLNLAIAGDPVKGFLMSVAAAPSVSPLQQNIELTSINTIRTLSMDGVQ